MSKVNLFHYATSELSQDAFICWLLAHGMEEHQVEDPLLCACALDFIRRVPGLENAQQIDEIKQQYLKIDVLVIKTIWRTWSRSRLAQKDLSSSLSMHGDMTAHVVSLRACKIDRQSTMSRAGAT